MEYIVAVLIDPTGESGSTTSAIDRLMDLFAMMAGRKSVFRRVNKLMDRGRGRSGFLPFSQRLTMSVVGLFST